MPKSGDLVRTAANSTNFSSYGFEPSACTHAEQKKSTRAMVTAFRIVSMLTGFATRHEDGKTQQYDEGIICKRCLKKIRKEYAC